MGCMHTHQRIPTIEECGSPSCIQSVVEKFGEDNLKAKKTNQVVSQMPTLGLKCDKIQT
jgi:hypothetical protein